MLQQARLAALICLVGTGASFADAQNSCPEKHLVVEEMRCILQAAQVAPREICS